MACFYIVLTVRVVQECFGDWDGTGRLDNPTGCSWDAVRTKLRKIKKQGGFFRYLFSNPTIGWIWNALPLISHRIEAVIPPGTGGNCLGAIEGCYGSRPAGTVSRGGSSSKSG